MLPAILGGPPLCDDQRWPKWPQWDDTERSLLSEALEHGGWWTGDGDACERFANEFAQFHTARFGAAVTNGTHTMEAALFACGVGEGDEVIIPGLTFVATAGAVLAANAIPVIVDVDPASLCIDLVAVEAAITPRTRAVIAVHVAGAMADVEALGALCARHNLMFIEDCAHAHGSFWAGRGAGSFGHFGSFSFQRSKLMTAGEGGALLCNDVELHAKAQSYINCGRVAGEHWYHHPNYGTNLRMTEWQGAILRAQLSRFDAQNRQRNGNAAALSDALAATSGLRGQARDLRQESQGHYCYVFHYDSDAFAGMPLATFEKCLQSEGIPLGVSYPSLNTLEMFRTSNFGPRLRSFSASADYSKLSLPASEFAAKSTVWVEHRVLLSARRDVLDIAEAAQRIQRHAGEIMRTLPL